MRWLRRVILATDVLLRRRICRGFARKAAGKSLTEARRRGGGAGDLNWFNRQIGADVRRFDRGHRRDGDGGRCRRQSASTGVDGGRLGSGVWGVLAKARQHRWGDAVPAVMERGSVGQVFLPARGYVRRQECPRHIGAAFGDNR